MAGAEALLHPNVARLLNEFGIDAPELTDTFVSSPFEYIVTDSDETVKSNYCDIVLANRVIQRLLG
jgi:isopentenyldiphosphate isomerase